jgi:hypothetical protein
MHVEMQNIAIVATTNANQAPSSASTAIAAGP